MPRISCCCCFVYLLLFFDSFLKLGPFHKAVRTQQNHPRVASNGWRRRKIEHSLSMRQWVTAKHLLSAYSHRPTEWAAISSNTSLIWWRSLACTTTNGEREPSRFIRKFFGSRMTSPTTRADGESRRQNWRSCPSLLTTHCAGALNHMLKGTIRRETIGWSCEL